MCGVEESSRAGKRTVERSALYGGKMERRNRRVDEGGQGGKRGSGDMVEGRYEV